MENEMASLKNRNFQREDMSSQEPRQEDESQLSLVESCSMDQVWAEDLREGFFPPTEK